MSEMIVVLGVPTLNRYDLLPDLIDSVERGSRPSDGAVIVDNGGKIGEPAWLKPNMQICRNGNVGVAGAWNLVFKTRPDATHVLLAGDDTRLGPTTLERMTTAAAAGGGFVGHDFSCFLIARWLYEKVGPFDEKFWPAYFEDNDYHTRMKLMGYDYDISADVDYEHKKSGTLKGFSPDELEAHHVRFRKCRDRYVSKWGGLPGHERFTVPFDGQSEDQSKISF